MISHFTYKVSKVRYHLKDEQKLVDFYGFKHME